MRVGIIGILHESNTFIAKPTTIEDFRKHFVHVGDDVRKHMGPSHHEIGGFLEGLDKEGIEAVPLIATWATPSGAVAAEALDELLTIAFTQLGRAGKLDGLLVAPHGAGVSEKHRDMDGYWLTLVRNKVGPNMPIVCTLDPHANVSPRMLEAVNATIAYRTNPHVDQRQRGLEAARLMARALRHEVRPTQAGAFPGVAINIERQHTPSSPCKEMYALADSMLKLPGVLSNSVILGFPYADVEEMGSGFVVVTDNDQALAQRLADELARYLVEHREEFRGKFISVEDAVADAMRSEGPVLLLDMGDNVGGGGPGDSTHLAHGIRSNNPRKLKSFVALYDPAAVKACDAAGPGKRLRLSVGGHTDSLHGAPIDAEVTVRSLHDGRFHEPQVRHSGMVEFDMGRTAIVETDDGMTFQLTSHRIFPCSLVQLTHCGLDPTGFHILTAKGVQAPVAAYGPVSKKLIRVNTPGSTSADMSHFTYHHRRKPLFPFEDDF